MNRVRQLTKPYVIVILLHMKKQFDTIVARIGKIVLGKDEQVRLALTCLFAGGHLLIEDLPGIGKTTLAKVLARCLGLNFRRIQFTSDMLPGDILGTSVFDQKTGRFIFHPGPIFTQVLLTDEINRATPKTQSALLEAMEERQVTIEGKTRPLERPFFVIATQNPLEQAGTFPLPESQLDRFLMRIQLGYPDRASERVLLQQGDSTPLFEEMTPYFKAGDVLKVQQAITGVHLSEALLEYAQDLLDFTRTASEFLVGLSPRAGLSLLRAARAWAYLNDRDHGLPEDLQLVLPWVVGHRLRSAENAAEFPPDTLMAMFREVPVP
jgi:MoxR-like ATPase